MGRGERKWVIEARSFLLTLSCSFVPPLPSNYSTLLHREFKSSGAADHGPKLSDHGPHSFFQVVCARYLCHSRERGQEIQMHTDSVEIMSESRV